MTDVFVSYAGIDRERAREVAETLAALGYDVWWDQKIPVGSSWDKFIPTKVREARCLIVLWSKNSIDSKYVREEVRLADTLGRLAPGTLDRTQPPFGFGQMEAAQLEDWHPAQLDHPEWLNLLHRVAELAGPPKTSASDVRDELARAFPRSPVRRVGAFFRRNRKIFIGTALGVVAGAGVSITMALLLNDPASYTRSEVAGAVEDAQWDVVKSSGSLEATQAFRQQHPLSRHALEAIALSAQLERNAAVEARQRDATTRQLAESQAAQQSAADQAASLQRQLADSQSRLEGSVASAEQASANSHRLANDLETARQETTRLRAAAQRQTSSIEREANPHSAQIVGVPRNCAGLNLLYQRDALVTAIERNGSTVTYVGNSVGGGGTFRYIAYRDLGLQVGDTFCGFQGTDSRQRVAGDGG